MRCTLARIAYQPQPPLDPEFLLPEVPPDAWFQQSLRRWVDEPVLADDEA